MLLCVGNQLLAVSPRAWKRGFSPLLRRFSWAHGSTLPFPSHHSLIRSCAPVIKIFSLHGDVTPQPRKGDSPKCINSQASGAFQKTNLSIMILDHSFVKLLDRSRNVRPFTFLTTQQTVGHKHVSSQTRPPAWFSSENKGGVSSPSQRRCVKTLVNSRGKQERGWCCPIQTRLRGWATTVSI